MAPIAIDLLLLDLLIGIRACHMAIVIALVKVLSMSMERMVWL
jgi:hypothetical protein